GDIDAHAAMLFEEIAAGNRSTKEQGLLLLIDPGENRVRLEVGYALEGTFPDAFIAYVEQRQMVPFFRAGRVADGILSTTELIVTRAQNAKKNAGLESEVWLAGSGGAGASTGARIGEGPVHSVFNSRTRLASGTSPATVLSQYLSRMQARDANPDLDIYTAATRKMLRDWVMTPAQMDNIVTTYRRCEAEAERIDSGGRYGVIRYPLGQRQCAPWFFENDGGRWALDLTMMQRAIRFGRDNSWHFERGVEHPYAYAFTDWSIDSQGYPRQ
ncbi:MAG: TPM domain-containing protein, partial [Gammaproteobacteria bacterium]|nr:TPM domain-containing protein [Gammaproteobacteria bacterium]